MEDKKKLKDDLYIFFYHLYKLDETYYFFKHQSGDVSVHLKSEIDQYVESNCSSHDSKLIFPTVYAYNSNHSEFLRTISYLYNDYNMIEEHLNDYYNSARNAVDFPAQGNKPLNKLLSFFSKIHMIFSNKNITLRFLWFTSIQHFEEAFPYNVYEYIKKKDPEIIPFYKTPVSALHTPEDDKISMDKDTVNSWITQFMQNDWKEYIYRVLAPIFAELNPDIPITRYQVGFFQYIFPYISNIIHDKFSIEDFSCQDLIDDIKKKYFNNHAMKQLYLVHKMINEYFTIIDGLPGLDISPFQIFIMVLNNHPDARDRLGTYKSFSFYESLNQFVEWTVRKYRYYASVMLDNSAALEGTHHLYNRIIDYISHPIIKHTESNNSDTDTALDGIRSDLQKFYFKAHAEYHNTIITKLSSCEDIFLLEFLDIMSECIPIKTCPYCNTYFLSAKKNVKYCPIHRNHSIYQRQYTTDAHFDLTQKDPIFYKYYNCFMARKSRLKKKGDSTYYEYSEKIDLWCQKAKRIKEKVNSSSLSKKEYESQLKRLCKELKIDPPHKYQKQ